MRYLVSILLAVAPVLAQGTQEIEPNDIAQQATATTPGTQAYGEIVANAPLGDIDFFTFTLPTIADLLAWTGPGLNNPIGDTVLELYDSASSSTPILAVDNGAPATIGLYSMLRVGRLQPGTYYIAVRGWQPSTLGTYTLDVVTSAPGVLVPQTGVLRPTFSGSEPNDPRQTNGIATASGLGTRNEGNIAAPSPNAQFNPGPGDYDFFSFTLSSAGVVTLATGPAPATGPLPTQQPLRDSVVYLLDAALNPIAQNDDDGTSTMGKLRFDLRTGLYYAVVTGKNDQGNYFLDIVGPPPLPTPTCSVVSNDLYNRGHNTCTGLNEPTLALRADVVNFNVRPEQPIAGSEFCLDITGAERGPIFTLLSDSLAPFPYPLIGFLGCLTEIAYVFGHSEMGTIATPFDGNTYVWQLPIPPDFYGNQFELQVAAFDSSSTVLLSLSNRLTIRPGLSH